MFTDDTVVTLSVISILIAVKSFSIVQLQRKILNNDFAGGNHV